MEISGPGQIFLFGCFGGAVMELLRWWKLRESHEFPHYARKVAYWFLTFTMIITGGLIAIVYGNKVTTAILAMNLGASTPAIIGALATQSKNIQSTDNADALRKNLEVKREVRRDFGGPKSISEPFHSRLRTFLSFGR